MPCPGSPSRLVRLLGPQAVTPWRWMPRRCPKSLQTRLTRRKPRKLTWQAICIAQAYTDHVTFTKQTIEEPQAAASPCGLGHGR